LGDASTRTSLQKSLVNRGYCGPAVIGDRLFMLDRQQGKPPERKPGERALPVPLATTNAPVNVAPGG